ncbi:MAG: cytochrome ubiquinol oxidase subunit I [Coriobacteriia bacterium]|nr:cytochrome ubiquinol oxidase subunit I [Coriobacteriia bacterium]
MDVVLLSRIQFAVTVAYHFLFVPVSIGLGLVVALFERRYYKSGKPEDRAASDLWIRIFAATFVVGVATGVTMEFAFGTNWATYSRFVGDIFGAPLAAEGLFAFFLESMFLGVLVFGRSRVSKKFYHVSAWLVWGGSMLSALWIIIANSWMQTPAGYKVVETASGSKAVLTDFFAAAFNPSTLPRYFHTIDAILITGGFLAAGVGAYYLRKGVYRQFGRAAISTGLAIAAIFSVLILPTGHWQAVEVVNQQPEKIAAMEGHWNAGPIPLGIVGWLNPADKTTTALEIPGAVSFLASLDFSKSYPGLNDFAASDLPPLQATYQTYHAMLLVFGALVIIALGLWWMNRRGTLEKKRWLLGVLMWLWILPELGIQFGWAAAEIGRQPWIVYRLLRTTDAISATVPAGQVAFTLGMFVVIYTILYVGWARVVLGMIKKGPALTAESEPAAVKA